MKNSLIRNRKDKLTLIFFSIGVLVLTMGGGFVYNILQPAPEPVNISMNQILAIGFIMICLSTLIHGFNPILLVKSIKN